MGASLLALAKSIYYIVKRARLLSSHPLSTSGVDASCTLTQAQRSYSPLEKARRPHYFLIKAISPVSVWSLFTIVTGQTDHFFSCLAQRTQILFMQQHDLRDGHWLYPCVTQPQD